MTIGKFDRMRASARDSADGCDVCPYRRKASESLVGISVYPAPVR